MKSQLCAVHFEQVQDNRGWVHFKLFLSLKGEGSETQPIQTFFEEGLGWAAAPSLMLPILTTAMFHCLVFIVHKDQQFVTIIAITCQQTFPLA